MFPSAVTGGVATSAPYLGWLFPRNSAFDIGFSIPMQPGDVFAPVSWYISRCKIDSNLSLCPYESAFQDGKNCHPDLRDDNLRLAVFNLSRRGRAKSFLLLT